MPPEGYCEWCRTAHKEMTCAEHEEAERQWRINNPHTCSKCQAA